MIAPVIIEVTNFLSSTHIDADNIPAVAPMYSVIIRATPVYVMLIFPLCNRTADNNINIPITDAETIKPITQAVGIVILLFRDFIYIPSPFCSSILLAIG